MAPKKRKPKAFRNTSRVVTEQPNENEDDNIGNHDQQRVKWLLTPVRDLAENWKIDIALALKSFLDELDGVNASTPGQNQAARKTNFAEAAILLQGSACVYSRKVDYVYQLCFDLIHALANQSAGRDPEPEPEAQPQRAPSVDVPNKRVPGINRRIVDYTDNFAPLDDTIQPATKPIDLKTENFDGDMASCARQRKITLRPMPMVLVPLPESDKSKIPLKTSSGKIVGRRDDFWMNTSKLYPEMAILILETKNVRLLNMPEQADTFAKCAMPSLSQILRNQLRSPDTVAETAIRNLPNAPIRQENAQGAACNAETTSDPQHISFDGSDAGNFDNGGMEVDQDHSLPPPEPERPVQTRSRAKRVGQLLNAPTKKRKTRKEVMNQIQSDDPWKQLDMDTDGASSGLKRKPFKKGRRRKAKKAKKAEEPVSDYLNGHVYGRPWNLPKPAWKKPSTPALYEVFWNERKSRMQFKRKQCGNGSVARPDTPGSFTALRRRPEEKEIDEEQRLENISHNLHAIFDAPDVNDDDSEDEDGGDVNDDFAGVNDAVGESGFDPSAEDARERQDGISNRESIPVVTSYEGLVRRHVDRMLAEANEKVQSGDLAQRVSEWEKKIEPKLLEEEQRRPFEVREYGDDILNFFDDQPGASNGGGGSYDFTTFAGGKPAWEVSRYFVAALMLANTENVELSTKGEQGTDESMDTLGLTLLSKERHHEQLAEFAAPSTRRE